MVLLPVISSVDYFIPPPIDHALLQGLFLQYSLLPRTLPPGIMPPGTILNVTFFASLLNCARIGLTRAEWCVSPELNRVSVSPELSLTRAELCIKIDVTV